MEAEKFVIWSANTAQRVGKIAIQTLFLLGNDLLKHSKPKRQPPRNDNIRAEYNIEKLRKNLFKVSSIRDNCKEAIVPNRNGSKPKIDIIFTTLGTLDIRLFHVKS